MNLSINIWYDHLYSSAQPKLVTVGQASCRQEWFPKLFQKTFRALVWMLAAFPCVFC